jgi:hypothetical protein
MVFLVKKLKSLYNGFLRDQQRKRQNYETVTKKVDNLKRLISLSDSDVHDLQREGFKPDEKGTYPSKVKVCVEGSYYGQDFDKPKEAGQYILEQLKNNKKVVLAGFGQRADVVFVTGPKTRHRQASYSAVYWSRSSITMRCTIASMTPTAKC